MVIGGGAAIAANNLNNAASSGNLPLEAVIILIVGLLYIVYLLWKDRKLYK